MNQLRIIRNATGLSHTRSTQLNSRIKFHFNQIKQQSTSLNTKGHSTKIVENQNELKLNNVTYPNQLNAKDQFHKLLDLKLPKNFIDLKSLDLTKTEKLNLNSKAKSFDTKSFQLFKENILKELGIVENDSQGNSTLIRWLKRIILIAFIAKLLQKGGVHCDYDINDMMLTFELQQRLLEQQQDNAVEQGSQQAKRNKLKRQQSKRSSIKRSGNTKDQRYGTVEEMIKHQMENSEDFTSVQERIFIKEIEVKRDQHNRDIAQGKRTGQDTKDLSESNGNQNHVQANIANHIFRSQHHEEEAQQKPQFDYSKKPAVINEVNGDDQEKPPLTESQQKIQNDKTLNDYEKTLRFLADFGEDELEGDNDKEDENNQNQMKGQKEKLDSWFHMDVLKNQVQPDNTVKQVQKPQTFEQIKIQDVAQSTNQELIDVESASDALPQDVTKAMEHQKIYVPAFVDAQNTGVIYSPSEEFTSLAKRIENFLKLRGINVHTQQPSDTHSEKNKQAHQKLLKLRLCNKIAECKDVNFKPQNEKNRDVFHHVNNFLHPPHVVDSIEEAKSLLHLLQNDESIIGSYIPQPSIIPQKSEFDTFSSKYQQPDPKQAEHQFNQYKYLSSTKKNCYIIVRNPEVAKYLKIPTNKIGVPQILFKFDKELNGKQSEPNCKIDGEFYHSIGNVDKMIEKEGLDTVEKVAQKIGSLAERSFSNTNIIEDVHDKIRQINELSQGFSFTGEPAQILNQKKKKLFVIKTNDPQSQEQINTILEKLSKLNKNEVSIIKTQSEALLKSLRILVNDEYGTIRLFDLEHNQQPIIGSEKVDDKQSDRAYFQRYVPNVPFQVESLSRWISNLSPFDKPHTEVDRSINKLRSSHPKDFEVTSEKGKNISKLVLFYKDGCKGCKMMQDLLSHLDELKSRLQSGQSELANKLKREICLSYRIQDPQQLARLQISKFNILNDDQTIQVPQTTPTIYLFNENNTEKLVIKTQGIFGHLNRMKAGNDEVVHDYMMRDLIEEVQRNIKKMEGLI